MLQENIEYDIVRSQKFPSLQRDEKRLSKIYLKYIACYFSALIVITVL